MEEHAENELGQENQRRCLPLELLEQRSHAELLAAAPVLIVLHALAEQHDEKHMHHVVGVVRDHVQQPLSITA